MSIQAGGGENPGGEPVRMGVGGPPARPILLLSAASPAPPEPSHGPAGGLDPAFRLGEVYAFPNPAKRGARPTLHVETGLADEVQLDFHDAVGRHLHRARLPGPPAVVDDGQGPQYAFEHLWENPPGTGSYVVVVVTRKAGAADLRKVIRLAVIR